MRHLWKRYPKINILSQLCWVLSLSIIFTCSPNRRTLPSVQRQNDASFSVADHAFFTTSNDTLKQSFVLADGNVYFVSESGLKYHVQSCRPCGPSFTVCKLFGAFDELKEIPVRRVLSSALDEFDDGGLFSCHLVPAYFDGYETWHRRSLKLEVSKMQPRRLNVLMTGVGKDLTGGPLSIIRFMNSILDKTDIGVRWINVDGNGLTPVEFQKHLAKYGDTRLFREQALFSHGAMNENVEPMLVGENDVFMATLYFSALICVSTIRNNPLLNNKNFIYFIQDFEPIFFPHDSRHLEALETYTNSHFAIYSTRFLEKWFLEKQYGQAKHLSLRNQPGFSKNLSRISFASEPAIKPWGEFDIGLLQKRDRVRKIIVYARRHADRNAYDLTINSLSAAVCAGIIDETWLIIGVGAVHDDVEYLGMPCGKQVRMEVKLNIPEPLYRELVRTGDVGLSLMVSPHPSLPPFDFVSAGLVTVTNSFETKTEEMFHDVSELFVVTEPLQDEIVASLARAVHLSADLNFRKEMSQKMNWESEWSGERCYGNALMAKILDWFSIQSPLWDEWKYLDNKTRITHP